MADKQPANRAGSPDRGWREPGFAAREPQAVGWGWTIFLVGSLLALASLLIVWLRLLGSVPGDAFYLAISIGEYKDGKYPVVPFARQGSERIKRHFAEDDLSQREPQSKQLNLLTTELKGLASRPANQALVVHITALALVRDGKVLLLPVDADPDKPDTWMPVDAVLQAVGRCPAHKLLILDLAHNLADPRLGVLGDRVAETLENHLQNAPPNFLVFCPCASGQTSLASGVLQSSAFNYYLDLGLTGAADGWGPSAGEKDDKISAQELCAYVENRVDHWAYVNRQARQKPMLFGKGEDFTVVNLQRDFQPRAFAVQKRAWPESLRQGWAEQEAWLKRPVEFDQSVFQRRQLELLRQEQRWQAGEDSNAKLPALEKLQPRALPALSLALACRQVEKNPKLVSSCTDLLGKPKSPDDAKSLDGKDYPERAWAVLEALAQFKGPWDERLIERACDLVDPKATEHKFVETCYLQELHLYSSWLKNLPGEKWEWKPDIVKQVFRTMRAREAVIAALSEDPALLPWVEAVMEKADASRHTGEKRFLWETGSWDEAANKLKKAGESYVEAAELLRELRRCRQALNESLALLPGYGLMVSEWPEYDLPAVATWDLAVRYTLKLKALFEPLAGNGPVDPDQLDQVNKVSVDLKSSLLKLQKEVLDKRLKDILQEQGPENPAKVDRIAGLLKCPLLSAGERSRLYEKTASLAGSLQDRTDREDQEAWLQGQGALPQPPPGYRPLDQALLREQVTRDLLKVAGAGNLTVLEKARPDVKKMSDLDPLELSLRSALLTNRERKNAANQADPWRQYCDWLAKCCDAESRNWRAGQNKDRPEPDIARFYTNVIGRLQGE